MLVENKKRQPGYAAIFLAYANILTSDASYEDGNGTGDPTGIALLIPEDIELKPEVDGTIGFL